MAATNWILILNRRDDTVDLERNGRPVRVSVPVSAAKQYLRAHKNRGDKVWQEEPDGYRTRLS